jgi:hypothetical protein
MSRFSLELTRTLRAALDDAALQTQSDSPTKAFMAEQILRAAADGVQRREELRELAVRAAQLIAKRSKTHQPAEPQSLSRRTWVMHDASSR